MTLTIKHKILGLACTALSAISATAYGHEGGTSSIGGRIFRDSANPWFLENTKTVHYCIEVAPDFGVNADVARTAVKEAFVYWQNVLRHTDYNWYAQGDLVPYGQIHLGTQDFVEAPCTESTDVRFQFGTLSEDQHQYLPNPRDFIAEAVRTDYDARQLKGRGFVYVSPENGPLKAASPNLADNPWSTCDGCILKVVVLHEVGHIFGVPHGDGGVMEARFPEMMVSKQFVQEIVLRPDLWPQFLDQLQRGNAFDFGYGHRVYTCDPTGLTLNAAQFFNLDAHTYQCIAITVNKLNNYGYSAVIEAALDANSPYQHIGDLVLSENSSSQKPLIRIWITPEQQVFTHVPSNLMSSDYLEGGIQVARSTSGGYYKPANGTETKPVILSTGPNGDLHLGGLMNGQIQVDILSN